jgi:hypothetical protein
MIRLRACVLVGLVASVAIVATAEAAPKKKKPVTSAAHASPAKTEEPAVADFDKSAAITAIAEVNLAKCKATNAARGEGHVTITFAPTGAVQVAQVDKGPWVGSPVAKCMAKEFKKAKVPAFKGDAVTVGKVFHFE